VRLQPQARVLAHDVARPRVVEPPVRQPERVRALRDGVAELVEDELSDGIVDVEDRAHADRDRAAPIARRVRLRRAHDAQAEARRRVDPRALDLVARERARSISWGRRIHGAAILPARATPRRPDRAPRWPRAAC
jgi:hypothetical protein